VILEKEKESAKKRVEDEETSIMIKNLGSKDLKTKGEVKPEKVEREKTKLEGIKVVGRLNWRKSLKREEKPVVKPRQKLQRSKEKAKKEVEKPEKESKELLQEGRSSEEKQPEQEL
jgi:translation initiation factor IF-2